MATYALINNGSPVLNGVACVRAPIWGATQGGTIVPTDGYAEVADPAALQAIIDGRFKHAGGTSWDRPGSDLPS